MTREEARQAWEKMRSEIDETNWLFVGTINPQMVDMAIEALGTEPIDEVQLWRDAQKLKTRITDLEEELLWYRSAQTDGDLISRADAIEAVEKNACNTQRIFDAIKALPSAEAVQGEWIPISERLPEENEVVLTQAKFKDGVKMAISSRIDVNYWTGWGTREINIIAWMPLPEPYKGGDDE